MTPEEEIISLHGQLYYQKQLTESYRKVACKYMGSLDLTESASKEAVQAEMAKLRTENGLLKKEIASRGSLGYTSKYHSKNLQAPFD